MTRRAFVRNLSAISLVGVGGGARGWGEQEPLVSAKDAVDHVLLGVADREAGIRWLEARTGVRAIIGGSHPGVGTHNALLSLGGRQYLEIIAIDPDQTQVASRYQMLKTLETPRLIGWAAATDDIERTATRCRAAGLEVNGPNPGARQRPDGKVLRWRTLGVNAGLEVVIPFFIEWDRTVTHPAADSPSGCRLQAVTFAHADATRARQTLARMGIDAMVTSAPAASLTVRLDSPKGSLELR